MKFYKTIMKAVVVAMAAMAVLSCQEKPGTGEGDPQLNEDLELTVDVEDITYTSAKIKVTHNGAKSDTWFGFLTEVVEGDEDELINQAVEAYMNGETEEGLRRSKSYVNVYKDLTPGTSYKYIAFGLSADGKVYGSSASVGFVTVTTPGEGGNGGGNNDGGGEVVNGMKVNKAWTVNYVGEGVINDVEYDHVVTVNSTDRNTYVVTIVYATLWDVNKLYDETVLFRDDMLAYIDEMNDYYGSQITVADLVKSGSSSDAFDLEPGYYMAVALGITPEGEVSGLYATSEVFEVKEQVPTEEYKAWLGDWTIVGENDVEFNVTLTRHVTNRSFWMFGWEGFEDIPVDVVYDKGRNDLTFYAQLVQENYYLEDYDVTADMYFLGLDDDNKFYSVDEGNYAIAIAGVLDGGQRALVRYGVNDIAYPIFVSMFYAAKINGEYKSFPGDLPTFRGIAAMNPAGPAASSLAKRKAAFSRSRNGFLPSETLLTNFR